MNSIMTMVLLHVNIKLMLDYYRTHIELLYIGQLDTEENQ